MDVIFDANRASVTIIVGAAEWGSTINNVVVERDSGQGWQRVRGGSFSTAGSVAISDIEAPLHAVVSYRVQGRFGVTVLQTLTGAVDTTVAECVTFLKRAGDPNATVKIVQAGTVDIASQTQGGVYDIAGGDSIAVAAYSGVHADRFTFSATTYSVQESRAVDALLSTRVLLFQPCVHEFYPPGWYFIESANKSLREAPTLNPGHHWSFSVVRAAEPSGEVAGVNGSSWGRVRATYATWGDVKANNGTWFDVLQGA